MPTKAKALLSIKDLRITVEGKTVVKGLNLTVHSGEIHAIMGPNGSGKSSLVNTLMGHPKYQISGGTVKFLGKDLLKMDATQRALAGLFLAFQYPKEIAGVPLRGFLYAAHAAQRTADSGQRSAGKKLSPVKFRDLLNQKMKALHMSPALAERPLNQGFSGGEKKKAEILQLSVLQPLLALLDETDSGLDIDALKVVAGGVNDVRKSQASFSALVVTHYARLLQYLKPDHVHVMVAGTIVESGGPELAQRLEKEGYAKYGVAAQSPVVRFDVG